MRLIGEFDNPSQAFQFVAYLGSLKIEAVVRDEDRPPVTVWVLDEDNVAEGERLFQRFRADPASSEFKVPLLAPKVPAPKNSSLWPRRREQVTSFEFPVTWGLIGICVLLALLSPLPALKGLRDALYFSEILGRGFVEIREGQIWRLFTPVLLHGGVLHLFFNMLWLYQLGGEIESEEGSPYLLVLIIVFAVFCNTAQYLVSGPAFVGLSGVVYALLGYIWVMAKRSLTKRYGMNDQTLAFMVVWLLIGLVGIIPGVANTHHVVGLILGLGWGWFRSMPRKRRRVVSRTRE